MTHNRDFWAALHDRTQPFDLLCHPFYQAWTAGQLSREDLREYAAEYYHHVQAFPQNLLTLAARLPESDLRRAVLENFTDEMALDGLGAAPHHALWLQFAEGMGANRSEVHTREPITEMRDLTATFDGIASNGTAAEALAAFYAYESQVPRVAQAKEAGLKKHYGADAATCAYFHLHKTADIQHSQTWRAQLDEVLAAQPELRDAALNAGETAACSLWRALDGIEGARRNRSQATKAS
jgi:pyrroloquinoline-quinone synthase